MEAAGGMFGDVAQMIHGYCASALLEDWDFCGQCTAAAATEMRITAAGFLNIFRKAHDFESHIHVDYALFG